MKKWFVKLSTAVITVAMVFGSGGYVFAKNNIAAEESFEKANQEEDSDITLNASPEPIEGKGTSSSPYLVTSERHLLDIAEGKRESDAHYKLQNNIELMTNDWTPIDFSGTFDGDGYTISNLKIGERGSNYSNLGLFGKISSTATIKNLKLQVAEINDGDDTDNDNNTGGLVGYNDRGNIENCTVSVNITEGGNVGGLVGYNRYGTIDNCITTGSIKALNGTIGGLVGYNCYDSSLSNSYSGCSITGEASNIGGIVGYIQYAKTYIENCGFYGSLTDLKIENCGGIVGYNYATTDIFNCYNNSTIDVSFASSGSLVGGIIGFSLSTATIEQCYNKSTITATKPRAGSDYKTYVGGLVGYINSTITVNSCFNAGDINSESNYVGGLIGYYDYDYYGVHLNVSDSYFKGNITNKNASYVGGLIGYTYDSSNTKFENCAVFGTVKGKTADAIVGTGGNVNNFVNIFYNSDLASDSQKFALQGLTMEEAKKKDSYALHWDFDETWDIKQNYNEGYPYLKTIGINTSGIKVSKDTLELPNDTTTNLTAAVSPSNASNKGIKWISSDSTIASVDENGKVTPFKEGTVDIIAITKDGGYTSKCTVNVTVENIIIGDVNGDGKVTAADAEMILKKYAGLIELDGVPDKVIDVDGDGEVTAADATQVLFKYAGYDVDWDDE